MTYNHLLLALVIVTLYEILRYNRPHYNCYKVVPLNSVRKWLHGYSVFIIRLGEDLKFNSLPSLLLHETSSNGNISVLLALCAGNSPVPVNSPHKGQWRGALMFSLSDLRPNIRLSKQPWRWWFETPSRSLWRHCNENTIFYADCMPQEVYPKVRCTLIISHVICTRFCVAL